MTGGAGEPARRSSSSRAARRAARRLALAAVFEAEFGQRTAIRALERSLSEAATEPESEDHARRLVEAVSRHRVELDRVIEASAPAYPVVQLARIDRALLRLALGELLHSPATPAGVAISEWVDLARTYSGEPARRLVNGVLGRVAARNQPAKLNSDERSADASEASPEEGAHP